MKMTKVTLYHSNGVAYVWNSDDWEKIRSLRIVGSLVGNLAALPRQDCFEGFPLALLPEETSLLLDKELAVLSKVPTLYEPPDHGTQASSDACRKEILQEQVEMLKTVRKREIEDRLDQIIKGKQAKLSSSPGKGILVDRDEVLLKEIEKIQDPSMSSLAVQIFTGDPWLDESKLKPCEWTFPQTKTEKTRYFTFRNLWDRGFFITAGGKFGADFLAYPGDPVKFHAHYIVICIDKHTALMPNDIIAYGRLGQSVRKTVVLAYLSNEENICFQSIQWRGQ